MFTVSGLLCVFAFCGAVVEKQTGRRHASRIDVCVDVATEAERQGVYPPLAVAVAWRESALTRNAVSSAGAVGPMQVIPRFWCRSKPCDHIEAGVRALRYYTKRYGDNGGLCAYFSGKPCIYGSQTVSAYRSAVIMLAAEFQLLYEDKCSGC